MRSHLPCVIMATQLQVLFLHCFSFVSAGEAFLVPLWLHIDLGQNDTLQIRNLLACYGEFRCRSRSQRQMTKGPLGLSTKWKKSKYLEISAGQFSLL